MGQRDVTTSLLSAEQAMARIEGLADVLIDCVEGGASVSFMLPIARATAIHFWRNAAADIADGGKILVAAEDKATGELLGTVMVVCAQPENQPHRADLSKMLVRRSARRRGVGAALMATAEAAARDAGKTLLVLDTASADAERLYRRAGWVRVGAIPDFALMPDGALCDTVFYYKRI